MANRIKGFTLGGNKTGDSGCNGDSRPRLAAIANNEHAACESADREKYRRAWTAGDALRKAKEQCLRGEWLDWLKANIKFPERTAQRYMAWAEAWDGKSPVTAELEEKWLSLGRRTSSESSDELSEKSATVADFSDNSSDENKPTGRENDRAPDDKPLSSSNGHTAPTNGASASAPPEPAPTPKAPPDTPPAATNGTHKSPDQEDAEDDSTVEGKIKKFNSRIEKYCRGLLKYAEDNFPGGDAWLEYRGTNDTHIQKIKDACAMLRTLKCHAVCPKCEGGGCRECQKTGRVPKYVHDQLT